MYYNFFRSTLLRSVHTHIYKFAEDAYLATQRISAQVLCCFNVSMDNIINIRKVNNVLAIAVDEDEERIMNQHYVHFMFLLKVTTPTMFIQC